MRASGNATGGYGETLFYAYTYPAAGRGSGRRRWGLPSAAYNADVGQFLLDYDAARTSSPDDALLDLMQTTYEAAANNGA